MQDWRHALVDNPNNGGVVLLMSQALFALGQYDVAANGVQMAMQMLPEAEWGNLVKNYKDLYPNIQNYTDQLKALEKGSEVHLTIPARCVSCSAIAGYLGYPKQAVRELDKAEDMQAQDIGPEIAGHFRPSSGSAGQDECSPAGPIARLATNSAPGEVPPGNPARRKFRPKVQSNCCFGIAHVPGSPVHSKCEIGRVAVRALGWRTDGGIAHRCKFVVQDR